MTPIYIGETQVSKMHFGNVQDLQKAIFNSVEMSTGTYGGSYNAQETSKGRIYFQDCALIRFEGTSCQSVDSKFFAKFDKAEKKDANLAMAANSEDKENEEIDFNVDEY